MAMSKPSTFGRRAAIKLGLAGAATALTPRRARAQNQKEVKIALVVPLSGPWARQGILEQMGAELAIEAGSGRPPKLAFVGDNSPAVLSFTTPIRSHVAKDLGLTIVADETYTPPLADATTLVQKIRSGRPDFIVLQSTNVGDDKLLLDKFAERGITASTVPLVGGGGHWTVPELMKVAGKEHLEGLIVGLANWPGKDLGDLEKRFVAKTSEPWFGHDSIFPYAHVMIFKEALERTASTDRKKLGEMMHKIDLKDGPAKLFPDGRIKYDESGRRVRAELCIVQWQKGRPVAVHPESIAVSKAVWPKLS